VDSRDHWRRPLRSWCGVDRPRLGRHAWLGHVRSGTIHRAGRGSGRRRSGASGVGGSNPPTAGPHLKSSRILGGDDRSFPAPARVHESSLRRAGPPPRLGRHSQPGHIAVSMVTSARRHHSDTRSVRLLPVSRPDQGALMTLRSPALHDRLRPFVSWPVDARLSDLCAAIGPRQTTGEGERLPASRPARPAAVRRSGTEARPWTSSRPQGRRRAARGPNHCVARR
jgi:hypothetical protein